jgi:hypothetical protein
MGTELVPETLYSNELTRLCAREDYIIIAVFLRIRTLVFRDDTVSLDEFLPTFRRLGALRRRHYHPPKRLESFTQRNIITSEKTYANNTFRSGKVMSFRLVD